MQVKLGNDGAGANSLYPLSSHDAETRDEERDEEPLREFCDRYTRLGIFTTRDNAWATGGASEANAAVPEHARRQRKGRMNVLGWRVGGRS